MHINIKLKKMYNLILRPSELFSFLSTLPPQSKILDVGCGNNMPFIIKKMFPSLHYTGIDITDYNQDEPNIADIYILTTSKKFANTIKNLSLYDAVVSSHNLEHVENRCDVLKSMMHVCKNGGRIFLAFPSEESTNLPSRKRTLNYFDDKTHKGVPPKYKVILRFLIKNKFVIEKKEKNSRPLILSLIGFFQEPLARYFNTIYQGTWSYYGFETIIWAKKQSLQQ